ncbi:MAG: UDP-N-acetylglucosamine 2-epimerase [Rickettsiales bacterium]|nr:UDP-N-acetylglucosamine 2-epimerase [Rickettsiales bacterium]
MVAIQRILLLCETETELQELMALSEALHADPGFKTVLAVPKGLAKSAHIKQAAKPVRVIALDILDGGFDAQDDEGDAPRAKAKRSLIQKISGRMIGIAKKLLPASAKERLVLSSKLDTDRVRAAEILRRENITTLVVTDDRTLFTIPWLGAAKQAGITSCMIGFAISHPEGGSFMRRNRVEHHLGKNPYKSFKQQFANRHPGHVYASRFGEMIFYKPNVCGTLEKKQLLPTWPWVSGGGLSDKVCVISAEAKEMMASLGIAKDIAVVGQCVFDKLWDTNQHKVERAQHIRAQYGIHNDKPILIFAVPHLAEHKICSWEEHERKLRPLLQLLAARTDVVTLLSLHPRARKKFYVKLAEEYGLIIAKEALCDVLPIASLFMATHSSTVRWAGILRIPSIVLDYNIGHTFLNTMKGNVLLSESDLDAINAHITRLMSDQAFYVQTQQQLASSIVDETFDGNVRKRIIATMMRSVA